MRHSICTLGAVALLLVTVNAQADAVMPPPEDCPDGTIGESSHAGPHCRPLYCPDAGPCAAPATCADRKYCWAERPYATMLGAATTFVVEGPCAADGSCAVGTCETLQVCATGGGGSPGTGGSTTTGGSPATGGASGASGSGPATADDPSDEESGCGCRLANQRATDLGPWLLGALLGVRLIRRRRPR